MPSAATTSRWKRLHGSRSSRAGTSVRVLTGAIGSEGNATRCEAFRLRRAGLRTDGGRPARSTPYNGDHDRQYDGGRRRSGNRHSHSRICVRSSASANSTTFAIILSLSFCHLLNDMMQSLVPALYPILKDNYALSFGQIGLITLAFQFTASMLQPVVGMYTDKKPQPYSLMVGMGFTLVGLAMMSQATTYPVILLSAALIGMGSSVFHPEASRVARMAAGGRYGLAQSLFQVGGNLGGASGPLLAAFIVVPHGQDQPAVLLRRGDVAMIVLFQVGHWYRARTRVQAGGAQGRERRRQRTGPDQGPRAVRRRRSW